MSKTRERSWALAVAALALVTVILGAGHENAPIVQQAEQSSAKQPVETSSTPGLQEPAISPDGSTTKSGDVGALTVEALRAWGKACWPYEHASFECQGSLCVACGSLPDPRHGAEWAYSVVTSPSYHLGRAMAENPSELRCPPGGPREVWAFFYTDTADVWPRTTTNCWVWGQDSESRAEALVQVAAARLPGDPRPVLLVKK